MENISLLSAQDLDPAPDPVEIDLQVPVPLLVTELHLSEKEQLEAYVARIADLEGENKALKESLRMEQYENNLLKESMKELN